MEPERIHDLTPAYALDALDAHEAEEFEQHLRHCEPCRSELAELQAVTASLAYAAPAAAAPDALRGRILEQARAERSNVIPFPARRSRKTWALSAAAALAACAAIGLGIWAAILHNDLSQERSAQSRVAAALALVAAPGTEHVPLTGRSGSLAVARNGSAVLVLPNLARPPAGKTYEAWVIAGDRATPAGLFEGGRVAVVQLSQPVHPEETVAVTVERKGGVQQPTQTPILTAKTGNL